MINRQSNKIYIDTTGVATQARTNVCYIAFTPDTSGDQLILSETLNGDPCLKLVGAVANQTEIFDFVHCPLVFNNGIYVQTISSGAVATIVTSQAGGTK